MRRKEHDGMKTARKLALHLIERYEKITGSKFGTSELKLQKLMYFLQRQSLALSGHTLFDEHFIGWVHGPVLDSLRFILEEPEETPEESLTTDEKFLIDSVICQYGKYSAWDLREKTHNEISWINSRRGLKPNEPGYTELKVSDIEKDAEKVRIYDPTYDMYLDEFDDADCEAI